MFSILNTILITEPTFVALFPFTNNVFMICKIWMPCHNSDFLTECYSGIVLNQFSSCFAIWLFSPVFGLPVFIFSVQVIIPLFTLKKEYKRILFSILKHGISWNAIVFRNLFMAFLAPLHAMEYKKQCYNIIVHIPKLVVVPLHCCIMVKASTRFFPHSAHLQHRK